MSQQGRKERKEEQSKNRRVGERNRVKWLSGKYKGMRESEGEDEKEERSKRETEVHIQEI